ncbi:hypothetical protein B0H10DRAFT_2216952 [Mycena sp. CBHHK59/15]|nr:hypothetical protein B0H10DRAFT_2216952 [Mycena sp. CBHHK59/15]
MSHQAIPDIYGFADEGAKPEGYPRRGLPDPTYIVPAGAAKSQTKTKRSRLSSLFSRNKGTDARVRTTSSAPAPTLERLVRPTSSTLAPTLGLEGLDITTTTGWADSVISEHYSTSPATPPQTNSSASDTVTPSKGPTPTYEFPGKVDTLVREFKGINFEPAVPSPLVSTVVDSTEGIVVHNVIPKTNGFVDTIISAYNQHHALVLRPDDVWIAILTQFNFYVNANAELLRANFVAHEGKKELVVSTEAFGDFGKLAREMVDLIDKNIVDPTLRTWALPDFSTTTVNDTTVSSILLMATVKAYFEYVFCEICCGIPRVTLEGTKSDWEKILERLEKLKEYGIETIAWYHLLVPVISRFVKAFDDPNGESNRTFWQNVAHYEPGGSGPSYYSGWISAFCAFNDRGKWIGNRLNTDVQSFVAPESLTAYRFWETYSYRSPGLVLDSTPFHKVDCNNIPPSYAEVDVKLVSLNTGTTRDSVMTAGAIGTRVYSSGDARLSASGKNDIVRPVIGWWLFTKAPAQ